MTKAKQQLKAYYKAKGLRGKRLKRAVWADYVKAMAYCNCEAYNHDPLSYLFIFSDTPEGHHYWRERTDA